MYLTKEAKELQEKIHSGRREDPFASGRLAFLVGHPRRYCAWIKGSRQEREFLSGYDQEKALGLLHKEMRAIVGLEYAGNSACETKGHSKGTRYSESILCRFAARGVK